MSSKLNGEGKILLAKIEERLDNFVTEIKEEIIEIKSNIKDAHNEFYDRTKKHSEDITGLKQWVRDHTEGHGVTRSWVQYIPNALTGLVSALIAVGGFYLAVRGSLN